MNCDVFLLFIIMTRHKLNSLSWQFVKQSDKCFSAVHPYESAHRIPVTIPRVHFRFRPKPWSWRGKKRKYFAFADTLSGVILENLSAMFVIPARSGGEISQRHNVMMQFEDFKHNFMNHLKSMGGIRLYM